VTEVLSRQSGQMCTNGHSKPLDAVEIRGVRLHAMTEPQCIEHIMHALSRGCGGWVVTANLDHVRRLVKDPSYIELCQDATLVVADGMPLIWASRLQRTPLPQRVAGSSLIWTLTQGAAAHGRSVFLLGGQKGTAEKTAAKFREAFPKLKVAGIHFPPFGFEKDPREMEIMRAKLAESGADIVYVALGSPKQERLVAQMRDVLPNAWWLGVGISFSFIAGEVRRAPRWMQSCGLEWVHRMQQEPRRLARRYLVHDLPFGISLMARCVGRGLVGGSKNGSSRDRVGGGR
jgi:N-acetylglucosaminyldiphosphoundecaprenol N-acetyl-beta-D-mannosaminyltransferase